MTELKRLKARLTVGQMTKLDNMSRSTGLNRTDVLHLLITNAFVDADGTREGTTVILDTVTAVRLLQQTRTLGNYLNQATRTLNRIAKATEGLSEDRTAALDVMEVLAGVKNLLEGYEETRVALCETAEAVSWKPGALPRKA